MDTIKNLSLDYLTQQSLTSLLNETDLVALAIKAATYYRAWGNLACFELVDEYGRVSYDDRPLLESDTLTHGEWSQIKPLYMLYAELAAAQMQEASRALGLEVYGRSASEIMGDINREQEDLTPLRAYLPVPLSI
jgi:hypothetical protein